MKRERDITMVPVAVLSLACVVVMASAPVPTSGVEAGVTH
jgi:hypothetical protein